RIARSSRAMAAARYTSAIPRREAPGSCVNHVRQRGRRECRVPAAPAASRAKLGRAHERSRHEVQPDSPGIPYAMVLTAYFVLSPVIGLSCHRHLADMVLSKPGRADMPPRDLT